MFCLGLDEASFFFWHMPHAPPISSSPVWSLTQYLVRSTNHEGPHYTIFTILLLLIDQQIHPCTILTHALSKTDSVKAAWLRHLAASLLVWRPQFNPRSAKVGYVVHIVQLGKAFLWELQHSHPYNSINAPYSCIHSFIHHRHNIILANDSHYIMQSDHMRHTSSWQDNRSSVNWAIPCI